VGRQRDSLELCAPTRYDGLPGLRFPGTPWSFPGKDQVAGYLEQYASHFKLPIRFRNQVEGLGSEATAGPS